MIFKNLYSLQNVQSFIFQSICMELCKCLNCFLEAHNKQLNQYCLLFFFFFLKKKQSLKKWFGSQGGLTWKNTGRVTNQPIFALSKKIKFELGIFWVR